MVAINLEENDSHYKIKWLLENPALSRSQVAFFKKIVEMAQQVSNYQALEKAMCKTAYDRYFHFLYPRASNQVHGVNALYDCGIDVNVEVLEKTEGDRENSFVISMGEEEKEAGYFIKIMQK